MKKSIKNTLIGIVAFGGLALASTGLLGCSNASKVDSSPNVLYSQKQSTENVMNVNRKIKHLGNDIYQVELNIDVNEKAGLNNFVVSEHCPMGWEIQNVSNNGLYKDEVRSSVNTIEWVGFKGVNQEGVLPVKDQTLSYTVKKNYSNLKDVFKGQWVSVSSGIVESYSGDITGKKDSK